MSKTQITLICHRIHKNWRVYVDGQLQDFVIKKDDDKFYVHLLYRVAITDRYPTKIKAARAYLAEREVK